MTTTCLPVKRCDFVVGDVIDGRYRVDSVLGEGTYGKVYKVTDTIDGRTLSLKVLKLWSVEPDERHRLTQRFSREYRTGLIDCQNLVHSESTGNVSGNPYIVMEYCPGGNLEQYLGNADYDVDYLARSVLKALKALHDNGKVHRDLKPSNVLFKGDGTPTLTDFGIAGDRNNRLTLRGFFGAPKEVFGTVAYMSPEQVNPPRGNVTVLPTTDIFSFGVLIYQLLTAKLPFGSLDVESQMFEYVKRQTSGAFDRQSLLSTPRCASWLPMIEACLQPEYKQRPQTVDDVVALLPGPGVNPPLPISPNYGYSLRVVQGEAFGTVYQLNRIAYDNRRSILTVGRDNSCVVNHIPIRETSSAFVSRRQCTLELADDRFTWLLRDGQWAPRDRRWVNSSNGTYIDSDSVGVNGRKIRPGDIITIGDVRLKVETY